MHKSIHRFMYQCWPLYVFCTACTNCVLTC